MNRILITVLLVFAVACSTPQSAPAYFVQGGTGSLQQGDPTVKVWVNIKSSVYHCPGSRWYGATKNGEYMTQKQALAAGNRPAYGRYCE